jgi:prepilin-type processing-associated H-X9-DG protein
MIVFGEALLLSNYYIGGPASKPVPAGFLWLSIDPPPGSKGLQYPLWHGRNSNVAFCDTHVESGATLKLFNQTNSAVRWNNDHQPHPETW